jgi:hypothetical protein
MLLGETLFLLSRLLRQKYNKMPISTPPTPTLTPTPIPARAPVDNPPVPALEGGVGEGVEKAEEEIAPVAVCNPVIVVPLIDPHP